MRKHDFVIFLRFRTDVMDPNALRTGLWCFGRGAFSREQVLLGIKNPDFSLKNDGVTVLWQFD